MKVELKNIKKEYNGRCVLDIEYLQFESGKIHAILGPNGSGKTTMLRLIGGLDDCTEGRILYNGQMKISGEQINSQLQKPYMFHRSVMENILLGIKDDDKTKALKALEAVGMERFAYSRACSLSGGEAQKVAVVRTLVSGKELILLDEPLAAIDIASIEKMERYIKRVNHESRSTLLIATHSPWEALDIADQAIIMWDGRVIEKGIPEVVLKNPVTCQGKEFMRNWRI